MFYVNGLFHSSRVCGSLWPLRGYATAAIMFGILGPACASTDLIHNGGFEHGLTGWTTAANFRATDYFNLPTGTGGYYVQGDSGFAPVTGLEALSPPSGSGYALADQTAPGQFALYQQFVAPKGVSSFVLTYSQYIYDWSGSPAVGTDLSYTGGPNQQARVDLLNGGSSAFSLAPSDIVSTFYANAESPSNPSFVTSSYDITSLLTPGSTYMLRFAVVENEFVLNQGIDDVHVYATTAPAPPGAGTFAVLCVFAVARRSKRDCKGTSNE